MLKSPITPFSYSDTNARTCRSGIGSFDQFSQNHSLTKALLIGGVSFGEQDALLDRGVDVLIATPGRLLDHLERGKVLLRDVKILVIDEADHAGYGVHSRCRKNHQIVT